MHNRFDIRKLTLPDYKGLDSRICEPPTDLEITLDVILYLVDPELPIRIWQAGAAAILVAMPEASINENGFPSCREIEVWLTWNGFCVNSESISGIVK